MPICDLLGVGIYLFAVDLNCFALEYFCLTTFLDFRTHVYHNFDLKRNYLLCFTNSLVKRQRDRSTT